MSSGVPCISTDVGDARLVIGDTGIVVPPIDAPALADALDTLLSGDAKRRLERGNAARERIRSIYSLETIIKQYEKLYSDETF
jgi:glycosyltransferase involved in cell wall biosynthesis